MLLYLEHFLLDSCIPLHVLKINKGKDALNMRYVHGYTTINTTTSSPSCFEIVLELPELSNTVVVAKSLFSLRN